MDKIGTAASRLQIKSHPFYPSAYIFYDGSSSVVLFVYMYSYMYGNKQHF